MTVGQVAESFGITVRTLHHYDRIGLVVPSCRGTNGYRLYTETDLLRLQNVVVYRRLGFALDEIATMLHEDDISAHLQRQRAATLERIEELHDLVAALDQALENHTVTRELFGDSFEDEANEKWGDTDAWKQSRQRVATYSKADWAEIKAETAAIQAAFRAAMDNGLPPTSTEAMAAAEQHRANIDRRFYDLSYEMHVGLAELFVADPRYYGDMSQYVHDAIVANASAH